MSTIGKSNISIEDGEINPDINISKWMESIPESFLSTEQYLLAGSPELPSPRFSNLYASHIFGEPLPKNASLTYTFAYAGLCLNLPIAAIYHELIRCGHRTTPHAVRQILVEIDRGVRAEVSENLYPPSSYTIRALVTFLLRRNVPAQEIWQNILDWSGSQISGGVSRVLEKRNIFERMSSFINHEYSRPDRRVAGGVKLECEAVVAYIDDAYELGFSAAQIVHYLIEAFPKTSAWLTKEYVYGVLLHRDKSIRIMRTGRRPWDRAGEEFASIAFEAGLSDDRVCCCLVMAGYDIECDLELENYFLVRQNFLAEQEAPDPPSPPAPAPAPAPAPEKKKKDDEKPTTTSGGKGNPLPREEAPARRREDHKNLGEWKPETYW